MVLICIDEAVRHAWRMLLVLIRNVNWFWVRDILGIHSHIDLALQWVINDHTAVVLTFRLSAHRPCHDLILVRLHLLSERRARMPQRRMVLPLIIWLITIWLVVQLTADVVEVVSRGHFWTSVCQWLHSCCCGAVALRDLIIFTLILRPRAIPIGIWLLVCHF